MITDMTTSVPVINTAHLERRNIHLISFSLFWTEVIKKVRHLPKQNNCVFAQNNLRVIIFLTLTVMHDFS